MLARREPVACHGGREAWSGTWIRGEMGKRPIQSAGRPDDSCSGDSAVKREAVCSAPWRSPRLPPHRSHLGPTTHADRMSRRRPRARTAVSALPSDVPSPGSPSMASQRHGNRRDGQSKRAGIGRCVDLTARTRATDMLQGAVGVIDPRCHPANARLLGTVQPNHSHLGFTWTRGSDSRAPRQASGSDKFTGFSALFQARSNSCKTLDASGTSGMHRLSRCSSNLVFRAAAPALPISLVDAGAPHGSS